MGCGLDCIAGHLGVSQYRAAGMGWQLYCNRKASGLRGCVLIQRNCIVTQQLGQWLEGRVYRNTPAVLRQEAWARGEGGSGLAAGRGRRVAYAHRLGQLGARAPGLVFNPVFFRLGIFPESLNEHCSL